MSTNSPMNLQNKPWLISNGVPAAFFFFNSQSLDISTKNSFSNKVWSQGGFCAIKVMDFKWGSYKYKSLLHSFLSTLPSSSSLAHLFHWLTEMLDDPPQPPPPFLKSLGTQKLTFPSALSLFNHSLPSNTSTLYFPPTHVQPELWSCTPT